MPTATSFEGFERAHGRAGVRNHTLLLSVTGLTTPTARQVGQRLRHALVIGTGHGSGHLGHDAQIHARCLAAFACHPNVGAVVVLGADRMKIDPVVAAAIEAGRLCEGLCLDDFGHDALRLADAALRAGARFIRELSQVTRKPVPSSDLALGLECGRSDPSSGLGANPLTGRIADLVVEAGGLAMIGETTEWLGAEAGLAERAVSPAVAGSILAAASARERMAIDAGIDLTYNNPSLTNIEGGLSTIEEKSLGAVAKSGSRPIEGVLDYGEAPARPGLWVMDAPAYAPESLTGFAAAGCSIALFTTGVGNSYTSALMPTIKLTANPATASGLKTQLDFTAPGLFSGKEPIDAVAARLMETLRATASGALTWGEILGDRDEVIARFGASL